jgi:hypothetical protein
MTANTQGKYCSRCAKNVIDFANLTDTEVLKIVEQQSTGMLCGRFKPAQLNRLIAQTKTQSANPGIYKMFAGLLLIASSKDIAARNHTTETVIITENNSKSSSVTDDDNNNQSTIPVDSLKNMVRGILRDEETSDSLPFAYVFIKGSKTGATTNINGIFEIVIPDSLLKDEIVFGVSYIGYEPKEFVVLKKDLPVTNKLMIITHRAMFSGAMVITTVEPERKWWQRKKKKQ